MSEEKMTKLERILISWDKDDRLLYAAARTMLRQEKRLLWIVALEYDVDIDDLAGLVAELREHEKSISELN